MICLSYLSMHFDTPFVCPIRGTAFTEFQRRVGHIIPEQLGGRNTLNTCSEVEHDVGTRYDAELIKLVRIYESETIPCEVIINDGSTNILKTGLKNATITADLKSIHAYVPEHAHQRMHDRLVDANPKMINTTVKFTVNPKEALLSCVHSAVLFMSLAPQRDWKNLTFLRSILIRGIDDFSSIPQDDWEKLDHICYVWCDRRDGKNNSVQWHEPMPITAQFDVVAFKYLSSCFGICNLNGPFDRVPAQIDRMFVLNA